MCKDGVGHLIVVKVRIMTYSGDNDATIVSLCLYLPHMPHMPHTQIGFLCAFFAWFSFYIRQVPHMPHTPHIDFRYFCANFCTPCIFCIFSRIELFDVGQWGDWGRQEDDPLACVSSFIGIQCRGFQAPHTNPCPTNADLYGQMAASLSRDQPALFLQH